MLNLKVKVLDTAISTRNGVAKASGKPYSIKTQDNVFVEMAGEVRKMPLTLHENESAYAPGQYNLDIEPHLTLNRFDALEFRPFAEYKLKPIESSKLTEVENKPLDFKTALTK